MKKLGILNSEISKVLTDLGHTDQICISDVGLPIPDGTNKIDIALKKSLPSFIDTLNEVLKDMEVEKIILAHQIKKFNKRILEKIKKSIGAIKLEFVDHEVFKKLTKESKAVIRTGEMTPYANIILCSGVVFK